MPFFKWLVLRACLPIPGAPCRQLRQLQVEEIGQGSWLMQLVPKIVVQENLCHVASIQFMLKLVYLYGVSCFLKNCGFSTQFTWIFMMGSLQNRYYTAVAQPHLRHNQRYQSSLGSPGNRAIAPKKKVNTAGAPPVRQNQGSLGSPGRRASWSEMEIWHHESWC